MLARYHKNQTSICVLLRRTTTIKGSDLDCWLYRHSEEKSHFLFAGCRFHIACVCGGESFACCCSSFSPWRVVWSRLEISSGWGKLFPAPTIQEVLLDLCREPAPHRALLPRHSSSTFDIRSGLPQGCSFISCSKILLKALEGEIFFSSLHHSERDAAVRGGSQAIWFFPVCTITFGIQSKRALHTCVTTLLHCYIGFPACALSKVLFRIIP